MSIAEMKWEITSSLDGLSEKTLEEFLSIINDKKNKSAIRYDINSAIDNVVKENEGLLKRLAQ